jgi:hypothetical protein
MYYYICNIDRYMNLRETQKRKFVFLRLRPLYNIKIDFNFTCYSKGQMLWKNRYFTNDVMLLVIFEPENFHSVAWLPTNK